MGYTNQRVAYGNTLVELGRQDERIVVLDADLGASTMGKLFEEFPRDTLRWGLQGHDQCGGRTGTDRKTFTNSFAVFGRCAYDQIRQTIAIGKLNVKICGSCPACRTLGTAQPVWRTWQYSVQCPT